MTRKEQKEEKASADTKPETEKKADGKEEAAAADASAKDDKKASFFKKNDKKEKIIRKALKNRFSPEFLNRLDNICYFNALSEDTLKSILYKELGESNEGIFAITGKRVVLSPEAESWILEKVKKEDNGARPVIRTIQQNIEEPISDMVINEDPALNNGSDILTAYLENDKLILR